MTVYRRPQSWVILFVKNAITLTFLHILPVYLCLLKKDLIVFANNRKTFAIFRMMSDEITAASLSFSKKIFYGVLTMLIVFYVKVVWSILHKVTCFFFYDKNQFNSRQNISVFVYYWSLVNIGTVYIIFSLDHAVTTLLH